MTLIGIFSLVKVSVMNPAFVSWHSHWVANSSKILTLTAINTAITTTSEVVSRTLLNKTVQKDNSYAFLTRGDGHFISRINHQSLISIIMTIVISLLGGPIYFFKRRSERLLFFVLMGSGCSIFAQNVLVMTTGTYLFNMTRLWFDLIYNATFKFFMFEFYRKPLVKTKSTKLFSLFGIRIKQDVVTSSVKNFILNALRLKG